MLDKGGQMQQLVCNEAVLLTLVSQRLPQYSNKAVSATSTSKWYYAKKKAMCSPQMVTLPEFWRTLNVNQPLKRMMSTSPTRLHDAELGRWLTLLK
jgi:hypothetical protein